MTPDWTTGGEGIAYQRCPACGAIWYFARSFCPACGKEPETLASAGGGAVHAATLVTRAPSQELRALAPYAILLVDMDEGFRMMAHGDQDLSIGDKVRARFVRFADRVVPHFERAP
jgi:uncharacterized OB-fold protein